MAQAFSDTEADAFYALCTSATNAGQWLPWRDYILYCADLPASTPIPQTWSGVSFSTTYGFWNQAGRSRTANPPWWQPFADWIREVVVPLGGAMLPRPTIP